MSYLRLIAGHRALIAFGFGLNFFSSFGQTFFIALFSSEIRGEFGLTHGSFGALYSTATLASGLCLVWLGSGIDRFPLRGYVRGVVLGLVAGAALFAGSRSLWMLGTGLFLLRLFGQGLMGHTSLTTMSRFFRESRGKALSLAALGFPAGEALFPRLFVSVKETLGWRASWWLIAAGLVLVLVPFVERVLRNHARRVVEPVDATGRGDAAAASGRADRTRGDVLRDVRFYLVLPAVLAPPFIATGLFFHQVHLVESKGWSLTTFAALFAVFGAAQLVASLSVGPLVDRWRASRLLPFYLAPLALALALLGAGKEIWTGAGFMALAGLSGGSLSTIMGAYWAEAYGLRHLGAIRAVATALMVFSTAAAPVSLGRAIDAGVSMETIAVACLGYVVVASFLAAGAHRGAS